jgi:chromosome segregation protein
MRIKRLEIIGFKSFVDKVSLDFQQGITGVVGPNGCGKSNIVDAIRWVMGEQSVKNLRGRQMEDIIFAGSDSRKPLGMAEVSLVFSTEDGRVPAKYLSFSEIQVTRRLYRDGDSEYFINKTPCRLLDIAELFMDTGVGAKAYSIIEQGKIGMILLSKPEERRFLIEEAAGVTKFKSRKQVALRKIDVTRQNLVRLGDIISEIRRQLNALQRQAKKAEKFRTYREELKEIELLFATRQYLAADEARIQVDAERSAVGQRSTALATELERADLALEEKRIALLEGEKGLTLAQEGIYRGKADIQAAENRLEFQRRELANMERHHSRFSEELVILERQLTEAEAELITLQDRRGLFAAESNSEEELLQSRGGELDQQLAKEGELQRRLEDIRRELFSTLSEIAQCGNQRSNANRRLEALQEKMARDQRENETLGARKNEVQGRISGLEQSCLQLKEEREGEARRLVAMQEDDQRIRERIQQVVSDQLSRRDELSRKESRLHSLQELETQFAGYGQGVRTLMLSERFKGRFAGVVADLLETDADCEALVEAVLGEKLQYLVSDTTEIAIEAIGHLKESGAGRSSFVMADAKGGSDRLPLDGAEHLLNKVSIRKDYRDALEPLLNGIYLTKDLTTAFDLATGYPHLTFVTHEGDMVRSGGIISGGSLDGGGPGLIHGKREIRELTQEVSTLGDTLRALDADHSGLKSELAAIESGQRDAQQRLHNSELRLVNLEKDLQQASEELKRIDERIAVKGLEDEQSREERDSLTAELQQLAGQESAAIGRRQAFEDSTTALQAELDEQRRSIELAREVVTTLKVRAAALKEKFEANLKGITRVEELAVDLRSRIETHKKELAKSGSEQEEMRVAIAQVETSLKELLAGQVAVEASFVSVRERYEVSAAAVHEEEGRVKEIRTIYDEVRQKEGELNLRSTELAMKLRHQESSVRDRHRLEIAEVIPLYRDAEVDEEASQARQQELQRLIDEIGDVNLMAIEEYQELEGRHQFLSSQREDLEESLRSLQKAIQRINVTTRKRFLETFHLVNTKFQEIFPRLFCGGNATLRLTDEENLLETGIEIIVQPPGKKLQSVSLLSGGEKALTAVALIFSIFLIKPSPFCLLDEVDAPLDDANIGRFNDMVQEMTTFSQFIIITHNKVTMGVADTLYGVTMEEPGVSKLVSVKLS